MADIGLNQLLVGYDIGQRKPGRVQRQVIRIMPSSSDKDKKSKNARGAREDKGDDEAEDESPPGLVFSEQELDIENRRLEELALVIGELLPTSAFQDSGNFASPHGNKKGASAADFDAAKHTVIVLEPGEKSEVLVQKLSNDKLYFLALGKKENGLCRVYKPAKALTNNERVIYYPEWTVGPPKTAHRDRLRVWNNNIRQFRKQYLESHEIANVNTASKPLPSSQPDLLPLDPALKRRGDVLRLLSWSETDGGDSTNLRQAERILDDILSEPPSFQSRNKLEKVARLFNQPKEIEEEDAKEIAISCQALAAGGSIPEGKVPVTYQPRHLLALCKALQSDRMKTVGVEEGLRLDIVTAFCTILEGEGSERLLEDEESLVRAARMAVSVVASLRQTGRVSQPVQKMEISPGTDMHQIRARFERAPVAFARHVLEKAKEGLALAIEKDRSLVHGSTASHPDVPTIIDALATADDHNHAMTAARDMARCAVLVGQVPVEQAIALIDGFSVILKDVLDAIDRERGQADKKDEGRMDRDEREEDDDGEGEDEEEEDDEEEDD